MPIYEYECSDCRMRQEVIQRFSDPPLELCPSCGGAMRKLFSSPAIQFKGSGFYKTDYASSGPSASKGEQSEASKESSETKSAKSESGAAPKSDSAKTETTSATKRETGTG